MAEAEAAIDYQNIETGENGFHADTLEVGILIVSSMAM